MCISFESFIIQIIVILYLEFHSFMQRTYRTDKIKQMHNAIEILVRVRNK